MGFWIFLGFFLLHLSTAQPPPPQYALIVPAVVENSISNKAYLHLENLEETVSVNVTLEYNTESYLLWEGTVTNSHFSHCFNFTVPPAGSSALAFIHLSAKGSSVSFYKRKAVAVRNLTSAVFAQTDKPVYKPGQKVLFRVITLDTDLKPKNRVYPLIYIQDPQGNRVAQWLNQSATHGILQNEFQTVQDTTLGTYQLVVDNKPSYNTYHWFSMEEYVLPTFEVNLKAPQRVSAFDEELKVEMCARYTYGQPVQGKAQLRVCRQRYFHPRCDRDSNGICEVVNAELGKDGCVSEMISTKAFLLYANLGVTRHFFVSLQVEGVVTEKGTGVQISSSSYIAVYQATKSVAFENIDRYYKRQIPFTGTLKLRDEDGLPLANGLLFLELDGVVVANYTTDENGTALFSIDTSDLFEPRYKLRAYYQPDQCTDYGWLETDQPEAIYHIQRFFSRSGSFVKIEPVLEELPCSQQRPVTVHFILSKDQYKDVQTTNVNFHYILMNKGKIIDCNTQQVTITPGKYSTFSITLNVDQRLAPRARLLVYSLQPNGDLIADSISLEVEKCFRNKVSLQFSEKEALPASSVSLFLEATSNSLCALRAVDKSVLLLRPGEDLSPDRVYNQMPYLELFGYYYMGLDLEDDSKEPCIELKNTFFDGMYYVPVNVTNDGNAYDVFQSMGLKVFINSTLQKPVVCQSDFECKKISSDDEPGVGGLGRYQAKEVAFAGSADSVVETMRSNFPETWIWDILPVDSSGKATLSYTVPDTITEWEASVYCLEEKDGFGMSRPASMRAFQPFFVGVTLPYSTIQKEEFLLKANVYNYLNYCIEVTVALEESEDFKAESLSSENNLTSLCANETKSHTWRIIPQRLGTLNVTVTAEAKAGERTVGRRDTIILPLLVEPEGIKKEVTQSSLICTKGTPISEPITLNLPENLVEGSARAVVSVLGDVMGTAMRNSENLLQMPYGCAEQNIAMFLSNLVILTYLNNTGQLTDEKRSRIIGHLTSGYQRQLSFRLSDGSFSTFGSKQAEGNLWLTAMIYKAFAQSKPYIFVDDNVLSQALIWIASKQEGDGCFQPQGNIYNNALKAGTDDRIVITAYVTASLMENGLPQSDPVVRNGLSCLAALSDRDFENIYVNALLAYTYSLAGEVEKLNHIFDILLKSATRTGGLVYWEREKRPAAEQFSSFYPRAPSAEIETNAYILLAWLKQPNLSQANLTFASQIAHWIVRQQNFYGGFSSSQDTPVALHALSEYGIQTFQKDAENTVDISAGESFTKRFLVNKDNSVLLQQVALPSAQGSYSVNVSGSGCAYIQTTLRYNIILPAQASGFALAVETKNASCTGNFLPRFTVVVTTSYTGERNTSNMAIVDMKMLSGFVPVQSSLNELQNKVMRVEIKNDHVFCYLEAVSAEKITFALTVEQTHAVSNIKPALVKIYDYYETDEFAQAEYTTACQQD
ncbi:ovostatin-like [Sceloporus undulatus]|uniref:ovostatin-like n=1 Tax=Sceloporus undulatus TaxID=8520 RepID=UPI001C4B2AF4|nr:ovostatin-like [Sceloporus undulatus]